ncbi:MAG: hypothetical protein H7831_14210 [Magnetococcus sp. WYHC-3]
MRARNIKPGFFSDEKLLPCSFAARILFAGLWCFADKEGRFLWKPKQIRIDIFPDQPEVDVITLLGELSLHGVITKYIIDEQVYGWIPHFKDHQRPHPHEAASKIPPFSKEYQCHDKSPLHYTAECPSDILIPDSLIPDSIKRVGPEGPPSELPDKDEITEAAITQIHKDLDIITERIYQEGTFPKVNAFKNKMLKEGKHPRAILHALVRCQLKKPDPEQAWGYCLQIMKVEDGNYYESDYQRSQG